MLRLKQGQGLNIGSESYIVTGCISYRNGTDTWDEYNLRNAKGDVAWLSVDNNDGELVISYRASSRCPPGYKLVDEGTAVVTDFFGNTDVDIGETVRFMEYEDDHGDHTYSVERWEDETEYSEGHNVSETEIQLLDEPPFEYRSFSHFSSGSDSSEGISFGSIIGYIIAGIVFIFVPLTSCLTGSCMDSCKTCSSSDPNYTQCQAEYNECVRARSIRQASRRSRSSSGGSTHHGK